MESVGESNLQDVSTCNFIVRSCNMNGRDVQKVLIEESMPFTSKAECTIKTTMKEQSRFYVQILAETAQESTEIVRFTIQIPVASTGQESFTCQLELNKLGMLVIRAKSDRDGSEEVTD